MHILQSTLTPRNRTTQQLYLRLHDKKRHTKSHPPLFANDSAGLAIPLESGDELSTDTFFGSFYRSYWRDFTDIDAVSLAVDLEGDAVIRVMEDTDSGTQVLRCERLRPRWRERYIINLPPLAREDRDFDSDRLSRIFVQVEAVKKSILHGLDFVTDAAPRNRVRLSIGLCTFNQEAYFVRTLARIVALLESDPDIARVYVVNQGNPFKSDRIREFVQHQRITLIEQRNLGGCGGFTRSLAETLATDESTHHLFMDDDIVLDERMIVRAKNFLRYASRPIALGAGMLDSLRPTVMYEAGAFLAPENRIVPYCHNVDLSDQRNLWHFNQTVSTDYNAWWFCMVPLHKAKEIGLPAPVFIRGDDFEYGQRLARAGVPTVTLPGIGIWHEPFYAKPAGWQSYYDLRNRLIFGATYPERVNQLSLAHVTGLMTSAILAHDYRTARLRIRAIEDFLDGPEKTFGKDPELLHGEIMSLARQYAPQTLDNNSWRMRPLETGKPAPTTMRSIIIWQLISLLRTGLGPLRLRQRQVLLDADAHPRNTAGRAYVLTNGPRSFHLAFTPDRRQMWRLMVRCAKLAWQYRRGVEIASRKWNEEIPSYRKPDWWAKVWDETNLRPI